MAYPAQLLLLGLTRRLSNAIEGTKRGDTPLAQLTSLLLSGAAWEREPRHGKLNTTSSSPSPSSVRYRERDLSSILLASCSPHAHEGSFTAASSFLFREGRKTSFPICNLPWTKKKKEIGRGGIGGITLRTRKGGEGSDSEVDGTEGGGGMPLTIRNPLHIIAPSLFSFLVRPRREMRAVNGHDSFWVGAGGGKRCIAAAAVARTPHRFRKKKEMKYGRTSICPVTRSCGAEFSLLPCDRRHATCIKRPPPSSSVLLRRVGSERPETAEPRPPPPPPNPTEAKN